MILVLARRCLVNANGIASCFSHSFLIGLRPCNQLALLIVSFFYKQATSVLTSKRSLTDSLQLDLLPLTFWTRTCMENFHSHHNNGNQRAAKGCTTWSYQELLITAKPSVPGSTSPNIEYRCASREIPIECFIGRSGKNAIAGSAGVWSVWMWKNSLGD